MAKKFHLSATLTRQSRFASQFGSERLHPGLQIALSSPSISFIEEPRIDQTGVLMANARALGDCYLEFPDGAKVRFTEYPIIIKAGSVLEDLQGVEIEREAKAA